MRRSRQKKLNIGSVDGLVRTQKWTVVYTRLIIYTMGCIFLKSEHLYKSKWNVDEIDIKQPKIHRKIYTSYEFFQKSSGKSNQTKSLQLLSNVFLFPKRKLGLWEEIYKLGYWFKIYCKIYSFAYGYSFFVISISASDCLLLFCIRYHILATPHW